MSVPAHPFESHERFLQQDHVVALLTLILTPLPKSGMVSVASPPSFCLVLRVAQQLEHTMTSCTYLVWDNHKHTRRNTDDKAPFIKVETPTTILSQGYNR